MNTKLSKPAAWILVLALMILAACGGNPAPLQQFTATPEIQVEIASPTPGSSSIRSLADVENALVRIEADGDFAVPGAGSGPFDQEIGTAGRGSGFIVDPSGLAVTSHHAVTGAQNLKAWVGKETRPRAARILGVSECADLALIEIEGDGFPYLAWHDGPVSESLTVYLAGFSQATAQYSLSKVVITDSQAASETAWAVLDPALRYSMLADPGSAGAPIVTASGQVVGVHSSRDSQFQPATGIPAGLARTLVELLRSGSVQARATGVNGQALNAQDGSMAGVWVFAVQPGSAADVAGIQAGDLISRVGDVPLAGAGVLQQYCAVLRDHPAGAPLAIEVLRLQSSEVLRGQLDGEELAFFAALSDRQATSEPTAAPFNENASSPGEVYYREGFNRGLSEWGYFVIGGKESQVSVATEGGRLLAEINQTSTWIYFLYQPYALSDVRIDLTAENLGRNNNNVSLICRYSEANGWYEFNIANNGAWTILRYDPRTKSHLTLYSGGSTLIKTGKETNTYTAICQGDQLSLGINGVIVRTITDRGLTSGLAGLSLASFNVTPVIVVFNDFVLSVP